MGIWGSSLQTIRSAVCVVVLPIAVVVCSVGAITAALRGATTQQVSRWYVRCGRFVHWFAGTDRRVHGLEHVEPGQAYIIVSNHESNWDPISIVPGIPQLNIRFLAKRQLMQIPIFGTALRLSGNIMVDRQRSGSDVKRLRSQMSERQPDVSMLFFAEGTRDRNGAFREFKMGAFATALSTGLPVLPVAVAGTWRAWRPDSAMIRSGPILVEIGAPIPSDGLAHLDRAALRDQTREEVGKLRSRARQRLRDAGVEPGGVD